MAMTTNLHNTKNGRDSRTDTLASSVSASPAQPDLGVVGIHASFMKESNLQTNSTGTQCAFVDSKRHQCALTARESGLCFWHDPTVDKTGDEIKPQLEVLCHAGKSAEGFSLRNANLVGVQLQRVGTQMGFNLSHADLTHANLTNGHLFRVNFRHSSLHKAKLNHANLNRANMEGASILGTEFELTKMEHVHWGKRILHEKMAHSALKKQHIMEALARYEEAEEIYRALRKGAEARGYFELAGSFFHQEMTMNRFRKPLFSRRRLYSKLEDLITGYGEKPFRVLLTALIVNFIFAWIYFLIGVYAGGDRLLQLDFSHSLSTNIQNFLHCLYYSVVTFTTLGYGDIVPSNWSRPFAALEAFTGAFSMSMFVVVFVRKRMR